MIDRPTLLRALAERPDDDTPRLMYADFLEESGDPLRAEFVRVQVEVARRNPADPARRPWVARHLEFLKDHVPGWKAELPALPGVEWGDFNRGLVEEVQADSEAAVVRYAAAIFAEPGVHVLRLRRVRDAKALAALPELGRVRSFRLIGAGLGADGLARLLASPHLGRVLALDLHDNRLGDAGAEAVAGTDLPDLAELWLGGGNGIGEAGGRALAGSPHFPGLRFLDLRGNRVPPPVRAALVKRFGPAVRV